jgi:hypothetical protein
MFYLFALPHTDELNLVLRYLTKIADQIVAMVSPEHAAALVWGAEDEDHEMDTDDYSDRLFTFEVEKTVEKEESVSVRPGIKVTSRFVSFPAPL